jgi:hypothetical protein
MEQIWFFRKFERSQGFNRGAASGQCLTAVQKQILYQRLVLVISKGCPIGETVGDGLLCAGDGCGWLLGGGWLAVLGHVFSPCYAIEDEAKTARPTVMFPLPGRAVLSLDELWVA